MRISSIDELIEAYKDDVIDNDTLIEILQKQTPHLAVWVDSDQKYSYSKSETLLGLLEYKQYLESGNECPIFFPEVADTSSGFSFNDACKPL
jgi:hypothetical protein